MAMESRYVQYYYYTYTFIAIRKLKLCYQALHARYKRKYVKKRNILYCKNKKKKMGILKKYKYTYINFFTP